MTYIDGENEDRNDQEPLISSAAFPFTFLLFAEQGFDPTKFPCQYAQRNINLRGDPTALCLIYFFGGS